MAVLSVQDLSIGRSGQVVASGLSFALEPGEGLLLTGPNGAGKTTLLRTLAGLLPALGGEISGPEHLLYGGHLDGIKSALSVRENLSFLARLAGGGDIAKALADWNLEGLANRRAADLSAGQRRRLGLARLSLGFAPLWLLDEPTSSLDAASVALFETALSQYLRAGGAAIIATHLPVAVEGLRHLKLEPQVRAKLDLEALW